MDIMRVVGIGLIGTVLAITIKNYRPELSMQIGIGTGVLLLLLALDSFGTLVEFMQTLTDQFALEPLYITTVLKVIGVAYLAEFGVQVCKDAGQGAIATKMEMAGKALILVLALPLVQSMLDWVAQAIP